jgi:Zn-dependent alcohol dehydrogenase
MIKKKRLPVLKHFRSFPWRPKQRSPIVQARALSIDTGQLDGPQRGEVLVEVKATGICHTDEFTLSGADPEGLFPAILGHEGAGIVVDIGSDVTSLKKGDHVIPLYLGMSTM